MGKMISRGNVHRILKNRFYVGLTQWTGQTHSGAHPVFVNPQTFERVQAVLTGHNQPKYSKKDIAFRGLMTCAYDDCMVTGEFRKENTSTTDAPGIGASAIFHDSERKILPTGLASR
jgi:Recombinase